MPERIRHILSRLRGDAACRVLPSTGQPVLPAGLSLPSDVRELYEMCGGAMLFSDSLYPIHIVAPADCTLANPVLVGDECRDDISFDWLIICSSNWGQTITLDCAAARSGRCYDSYWDRHGLRGDCHVIALSFTDLLEQLLEARGRWLFWTLPSFQSLGDAYDGVDT